MRRKVVVALVSLVGCLILAALVVSQLGPWLSDVASSFSHVPAPVTARVEKVLAPSGPTGPSPAPLELTLDQRIANACALFPSVPTAESVARSMESLRSVLGITWSHKTSTETLLLNVCQFSMERVVGMLQSFEMEPETSLKDSRTDWCWHGAAYAQALTFVWTSKEYVLWYQRCAALFAYTPIPPFKSVPRASPSPLTSPTPSAREDEDPDAAKKVCPGFRAVAAKYAAIASGAARSAELAAYGRGLAACGPDQKPWEVFATEEGRSGFIRTYVFPYINREGARTSDAASYATIAHAWQFD